MMRAMLGLSRPFLHRLKLSHSIRTYHGGRGTGNSNLKDIMYDNNRPFVTHVRTKEH